MRWIQMDRRDSKQAINQPLRFSKQFVCYSQARQQGVKLSQLSKEENKLIDWITYQEFS